MTTFTKQALAALGTSKTGLTGTLGYTVKDTAGATLVARTTAGVSESGSSGTYFVAIASFDYAWSGRIEWDAGAGLLAAEDFVPSVATGDTYARIGVAGAGLTSVALTTGEHALIANDVLDAAQISHNTAGSIGNKIGAAASAGDPWTTALPGSYVTGSAGKIVGTNLDAQASLIKAKTDGLNFTGANVQSTPQTSVSLNMAQSVPTSNTVQTVGDSLNAARADGFGRWVISGNTISLYAGDAVTIVRTFTLDSAVAPTSRT